MCYNETVRNFLLGKIVFKQFNKHFANMAKERQKSLTKPEGSLGKLEDYAEWMAGWQCKVKPSMDNFHCNVFAANHGVAKLGVSAYPSNVTAQMVENYKSGGAAINQLCKLGNITLSVIPIELEKPTKDFSKYEAMTEDETISAMQIGYDSVPNNCDLLILGEMGIANTSAATAISCALFNESIESWTGKGTGISDKIIQKKISIIKTALNFHKSKFDKVEQILGTFGGREMAAIAGAVIAARVLGIPVLLDGFISTASAATLIIFKKDILDHCLVSHLSSEPGHKGILSYLNKEPILDLNLRLGEGSGGAVAALIIKSALITHNHMKTFSEAQVSEKT